jgi:hypothetical protein
MKLLDSKILSFGSFRESEDLSSIISDLEDLGFNDRRFSLPEIKEAWKKISWSYGVVDFSIPSLSKYNYNYEMNSGGRVKIVFEGQISCEVDLDNLGEDLTELLPKIPRIANSGPRWTLPEIRKKLDYSYLEDVIGDWLVEQKKEQGPNWWIEFSLVNSIEMEQDVEGATIDLEFKVEVSEDRKEFKSFMTSSFMDRWLNYLFEKK